MTRPLFALITACTGTIAGGCAASTPTEVEEGTAPECQLDTEGERTPGYPFSVETFAAEVMPVLGDCATAGCHAPPTGNGTFTVWADAVPGDCNFGKTFNNVVAKIDLATPANSRLTAVLSGGSTTHPFLYEETASQLSALRQFIETAAATYANDGGGGTPPPGPSPFDYAVFQSTIQPMLNGATCAASGCHGSASGGMKLNAAPAQNSPEMEANFLAITARTNLADPPKSTIYVRATTQHASGASRTVAPDQGPLLLAWIEEAKRAAGNGNGNPTCAPVAMFNLGVFTSEILPILSGDVDLNDGVAAGAGCRSTACHGIDRGPGTFSLPLAADGATLLQNVACFVNLTSPSASELLLCPLDAPGCRRSPHPGQDVFFDGTDRNFQRLLAFLYGGRAEATPHDFAFFARKINTIFNDVNSVEAGAQNRTCGDTTACHGIGIVGQAPPNGSDFGILPNASNLGSLSVNFVAATSFVNFLDPSQSSLFLYPTNEIANLANPLATGLPHPGGIDFAVDSREAQDILKFATGLRPDNNGFVTDWLVAGDYPATQVFDSTIVNETGVAPQIFDTSGGAFNVGIWDGFFADDDLVDLNVVFPRAATSGRIGYAVAYLTNTVPYAILVQVRIATDNPIQVYVNGALTAQNVAPGGTTALVTLPPAGGAASARLMVKLLQRSTDRDFSFSAELSDQFGNLLTNESREIVVNLGPKGGI